MTTRAADRRVRMVSGWELSGLWHDSRVRITIDQEFSEETRKDFTSYYDLTSRYSTLHSPRDAFDDEWNSGGEPRRPGRPGSTRRTSIGGPAARRSRRPGGAGRSRGTSRRPTTILIHKHSSRSRGHSRTFHSCQREEASRSAHRLAFPCGLYSTLTLHGHTHTTPYTLPPCHADSDAAHFSQLGM